MPWLFLKVTGSGNIVIPMCFEEELRSNTQKCSAKGTCMSDKIIQTLFTEFAIYFHSWILYLNLVLPHNTPQYQADYSNLYKNNDRIGWTRTKVSLKKIKYHWVIGNINRGYIGKEKVIVLEDSIAKPWKGIEKRLWHTCCPSWHQWL